MGGYKGIFEEKIYIYKPFREVVYLDHEETKL
jgi:hypothetical protein